MTDAYAANLSVQSFTFIGNGSTPLGVLSQQSFSVKVTGLRGAEAVAAAVNISALTLPTGLTVTSDNHLTAPTLTFTATTSLTVTTLAAVGNMVTLPVVLDGGKVTLNRAISLQIAPTGVGVDELVTQYYLSTSNSTQTGGSWSATPAAYVSGRYYWKREKVDWTDGSTSYTDAVLDNALTDANANAMQAGQPNISPFYARVPYVAGDYWTGWSGTLNNPLVLTPLSDGWVHVKYDNRSGSDISRCDEQMVRSDMVKEGADYTFLIEVRNNTSTGSCDFYIVQTDNCQFWGSGIKKNLEGNNDTSTSTNFSAENVARDGSIYHKRFVKTSESTGSSHWTGAVNRLCSLTFRAGAGVLAEYDIRVSLYEGEYWGPYKPYVDYGLREEVENLEVGGRNLLLGTGEPVEKTIVLNANNYMTIDAYKTAIPVPQLFAEGDYLTISFDWETTATDGYFRVECGTVTPYVWGSVVKATGGRAQNSQYTDFASDNTSGHFSIIYKVTSAVASATSSLQWLRIRIDGAATSGKTFKIANAKVERGKNATDWTPAPEDIDADITAVETIANNAMTAANGKNTIYHQSTQPTGTFTEGDTWFDTANDYAMYTWDGSDWVLEQFGEDSIAAGAIKAGHIDAGAITAAMISGKDITGGTFRTTLGDSLYFEIHRPSSGEAVDPYTPASPEQVYSKLQAQGLFNLILNNDVEVSRSRLIPCIFSAGAFYPRPSEFTGDGQYGWFADHFIYAERLYSKAGKLVSVEETRAYRAMNATAIGVSGLSAIVNDAAGIVVLRFESFSFLAGTGTDTAAYHLPTALYPAADLDLVSTHNGVRFRITAEGYIQPYTAVPSSGNTAIRGSFTYIAFEGF